MEFIRVFVPVLMVAVHGVGSVVVLMPGLLLFVVVVARPPLLVQVLLHSSLVVEPVRPHLVRVIMVLSLVTIKGLTLMLLLLELFIGEQVVIICLRFQVIAMFMVVFNGRLVVFIDRLIVNNCRLIVDNVRLKVLNGVLIMDNSRLKVLNRSLIV